MRKADGGQKLEAEGGALAASEELPRWLGVLHVPALVCALSFNCSELKRNRASMREGIRLRTHMHMG